ncbi:unnamed protein product [Ectocarpus sp. 13 AM-2016]
MESTVTSYAALKSKYWSVFTIFSAMGVRATSNLPGPGYCFLSTPLVVGYCRDCYTFLVFSLMDACVYSSWVAGMKTKCFHRRFCISLPDGVDYAGRVQVLFLTYCLQCYRCTVI